MGIVDAVMYWIMTCTGTRNVAMAAGLKGSVISAEICYGSFLIAYYWIEHVAAKIDAPTMPTIMGYAQYSIDLHMGLGGFPNRSTY